MLKRILGGRDSPRTKARQAEGYVLYRYLKPDGSFDYERYREVQQTANKGKLNEVWVREENIAFLAHYIRSLIPSPQFGICHGTRRGREQEWFRKHVGCEVIGTEISDTATSFPHTIQWDFHDVRPEWMGAADFIYSNSFDHSYDPEKCLNAWMSCLKAGGVTIIEHTSLHEPAGASERDPFGADLIQMPYLITRWGNGRYGVRQLLDAPSRGEHLQHATFIVVQNF
jgi:hypothetical protein